MQLLFIVDQSAAILRGVDAPSSTVRLDVDPAELTQVEREAIASVLYDGHDCTKQSLDFSGVRIVLPEPTLAGVREGIASALAKVEQKRQESQRLEAEQKAREEERRAQADAKVRAILTERPTTTLWVTESNSYGNAVADSLPVTVPVQIHHETIAYASEELAEAARAYDREAGRVGAAAISQARAEIRASRDAKIRALLTEEQIKRYDAGVLPEKEIDGAIRKKIPRPAGVDVAPRADKYRLVRDIKSLSAKEFASLETLRAAMEGTDVVLSEPMEVIYYRAATEDDDAEEIDKEGDVEDHRTLEAHASLSIAGTGKRAGIFFLLGER